MKKAIKVSAPEYVDYLMTWVQNQLDDETIFPSKIGVPFPKNFQQIVKNVSHPLLIPSHHLVAASLHADMLTMNRYSNDYSVCMHISTTLTFQKLYPSERKLTSTLLLRYFLSHLFFPSPLHQCYSPIFSILYFSYKSLR